MIGEFFCTAALVCATAIYIVHIVLRDRRKNINAVVVAIAQFVKGMLDAIQSAMKGDLPP